MLQDECLKKKRVNATCNSGNGRWAACSDVDGRRFLEAEGRRGSFDCQGAVGGYAEIGAGSDGVVLTTARERLKGCCAARAVPVGAFKVMQVAAGGALPEDVTLKITAE